LKTLGFLFYQEGWAALSGEGRHLYRIKILTPPHARLGIGALRIIGERDHAEGTELLLSYEDYERMAPPKGGKEINP
jgi:hypothetical protein